MGLSKTEMKRLLAAMPVDSKTNAIKYSKFKDIFTEGTVLLTEQLWVHWNVTGWSIVDHRVLTSRCAA